MSHLSIRWRLTLWYGTVLLIILIGFSGAAYLLMERHLYILSDAALSEELAELADEVRRAKSLVRLPESLKLRFPGHEGYELQVLTESHRPLFQSLGMTSTGLPSPAGGRPSLDVPAFEDVILDHRRPARLVSFKVAGPAGPLLLQAAVTLVPNARALQELATVFLTLGPIALVSAIGGGYWLARKALSPVERMAATAAEITAARLDRRLAEPESQDELRHLAQTFNTMISRLQRSFDEVRRFTADAAHELRTPLAAMRTEAEVALRSPRSPEWDARVLENLLEEIDRLGRLVTQLLFLCREDTGIGVGALRPVRLADLVHQVGEHMDVVAREKGLGFVVAIPGDCEIRGEPDRLRQLFFNLLDNAFKYTPAGGGVIVKGEVIRDEVRVTVTDTGIGIPDQHIPHVFERFYRVDSARSADTAGTGLGLAICLSIAESHGGRLLIASPLGGGTRVTLVFPTLTRDSASPNLKDWSAAPDHCQRDETLDISTHPPAMADNQ